MKTNQKILGLRISHKDGMPGVISFLDAKKAWFFAVDFDDGIQVRKHVDELRVGEISLKTYLLNQYVSIDDKDESLLVQCPETWYEEIIPLLEEPDTTVLLSKLRPEILVNTLSNFDDISLYQAEVLRVLNAGANGKVSRTQLDAFWKKHRNFVVSQYKKPSQECGNSLLMHCCRIWPLEITPLLRDEDVRTIINDLPANVRIDIFANLSDVSPYLDEVIQVLRVGMVGGVTQNQIDKFWEKHNTNYPDNPLYRFTSLLNQVEGWIIHIFPNLPLKDKFLGLLERRRNINFLGWGRITSFIKDEVSLEPELSELLSVIPMAAVMEFLIQEKDLTPYMREVKEIFKKNKLSEVTESLLEQFWKVHTPLSFDHPLISFAPAQIQNKLWFAVCFPTLSIENQISGIKERYKLIQECGWEIVTEHIKQCLHSQPGMKKLLRCVPLVDRIHFFTGEVDLSVYRIEVEEALNQALDSEGVNQALSLFWSKHLPLDSSDFLFAYAPLPIQQTGCKKKFAQLIELVDVFFDSFEKKPMNFPATLFYSDLNDDDRTLASKWGSQNSPPWEIARMLSARAAEKVAIQVYQELGYEVIDTSIEQIKGDPQKNSWKTHDLYLNDCIPVDVKNSRTPLNADNSYVEHVVPQFKSDRDNREVRIAGVLSPYLKLTDIDDPGNARFNIPDIRYLGETSRTDIEYLGSVFNSPRLEVQTSKVKTIPPWLFNYPEAWYAEYDTHCQRLRDVSLWPRNDEYGLLTDSIYRISIIPKLIAAKIPLTPKINEILLPWQQKFCQQLVQSALSRMSIPYLFLSILTDFLNNLSEVPDAYDPTRYLELLFERDTPDRGPLGLLDSLEIIKNLCSTLSTLWSSRHYLDLGKYKKFRLQGIGILQGCEPDSKHWSTILAYCGGYIKPKLENSDAHRNEIIDDEDVRGKGGKKVGKCGNTPLILGREKLCKKCNKLICNICSFCSKACERSEDQVEITESPSFYNYDLGNANAPNFDSLVTMEMYADWKSGRYDKH